MRGVLQTVPLFFVTVAAAACASDGAGQTATGVVVDVEPSAYGNSGEAWLPENTVAKSVVADIRRRFLVRDGGERIQLVSPGATRGFRARNGHIEPSRPSFPGVVPASLPTHADREWTLAHDDARVAIRLVGASGVPAAVADDALVFDNALPDATLVHVPSEHGTEEFVELRRRPERRELRYRVRMLERSAGLRLVNGVVEVVGTNGDPLFHTTQPLVVDEQGRSRSGTIRIEGCAYDTNDAAPWGRPVVSPGATECTVVTSWNDEGLTYPLLVDPAWTDAGTLAVPRRYHSAASFTNSSYTACNAGCVLVTGGRNASPGYISTVELYSVSAGTWSSVTAIPSGGRIRHSSSSMGDGRVMVAGGYNAGQLNDTQTYDPSASPAWKSFATLPGGARDRLAVIGFQQQNGSTSRAVVVAIGGYDGIDASKAFDVFLGDTGLWYGASTFAQMPTARYNAAYAAWADGCTPTPCTSRWRAIGVGGTSASTGDTAALEAFNSGTGTWTSASLPVPRSGLAAVELDDRIILAGGAEGSLSTSVDEINKAAPTTITKLTVTLAAGRTQLVGAPFGTIGSLRAMFTGGYTSTAATDGTESSKSDLVTTTPASYSMDMLYRRGGHQAVRLANGNVLVISGVNVVGTTTTFLGNEVYAPGANGTSCTKAGDCLSLSCVDGYCCNTACTEQCAACDVGGKLGTCSPVTGTPHGSRTACTGAGTTCGASCNGTVTTSCTFAAATTPCGAASCAAGKETPPTYCTGSGACATPVIKDCGAYVCGSTACKTTCATVADCATGYACKGSVCATTGGLGTICSAASECTSGFCTESDKDGVTVCCSAATCPTGYVCAGVSAGADAGKCVKKKKGVACTTKDECASGFCVDGHCCDGVCAGQCEACDIAGAEGTCSPVTGAVHGSRTPCSDGGGDVCKALACDGSKDRGKCAVYAGGLDKECSPATCKAGVATEAATCDGAGACKTPTTKSCSPYACDTTKCKTTCTATADCAASFDCDKSLGQCVPVKATCSADGLSSIPIDKSPPRNCAPFRCNASTGDCFFTCATSDQCQVDYSCDGTTCVPSAPQATGSDSGGCGCETGPGRAGASGTLAALALIGLLGLAARRTRT